MNEMNELYTVKKTNSPFHVTQVHIFQADEGKTTKELMFGELPFCYHMPGQTGCSVMCKTTNWKLKLAKVSKETLNVFAYTTAYVAMC